MNEPAISIRSVSKHYRLGGIGMTTLRDELRRIGSRLRGQSDEPDANKPVSPSANRDFWALRDISFDIPRGGVVGIIGHNGAGKSTLLKILSRITEPTEGEIHLRGRIASLLEVGTGFHPELSGAENIYLNGAMLGMSRKEIQSKFDEIVAFSEIGSFLSTPVKRYSSGMYVRLAFAVAAHLEPEILIIDEVLAVGDVAFQRKCLGKVQDISRAGDRTVIFVSHNMTAVESICTSCMFLKHGRLVEAGNDVPGVIRRYLADHVRVEETPVWTNSGRQFENPWFRARRMYLSDEHGEIVDRPISNNEEINVVIEGDILQEDDQLQIGYGLLTGDGELLFWTTERDLPEEKWARLEKGPVRFVSKFPARTLNEGTYRLDLFAGLYHRKWLCEPGKHAPSIHLTIHGGLSDSPCWMERRPGHFAPVIPWSVQTGDLVSA